MPEWALAVFRICLGHCLVVTFLAIWWSARWLRESLWAMRTRETLCIVHWGYFRRAIYLAATSVLELGEQVIAKPPGKGCRRGSQFESAAWLAVGYCTIRTTGRATRPMLAR